MFKTLFDIELLHIKNAAYRWYVARYFVFSCFSNFFPSLLVYCFVVFFYVVNKDEHKLHHKGPLL